MKEATSWTNVRVPAGAAFCENERPWFNNSKLTGSDVGRWQHDQCEGYVPRGHQNTLLRLDKGVYWQNWTTKHESEELRGRVWLKPINALLKRKAKKQLDGKACCASKIVGHQRGVDTNKASRREMG